MKQFIAALAVITATMAALPATAATDDASVRPIHRVDPEFPRFAFRSGVSRGVVSARVTLGADGHVTAVEVINAEPKRVFDEAVVQALSQWRYAEGRPGRRVDVEIAFNR